MPNLDDEQFEIYLKRFRPQVPEALPLEHRSRSRPSLLGLTAVAVILLILATSASLFRHSDLAVTERSNRSVSMGDETRPLPPLTLGAANSLLAEAPSVKKALDSMAFRPPVPPFPEGKQSAIAALRKERFKL